jgi:hypothetical protein
MVATRLVLGNRQSCREYILMLKETLADFMG